MQKIQKQLALLACLALPVSLVTAQGTPPAVRTAPAVAAQAPAPQMIVIRVSRVNPGMRAEYQAFQKNEVVPMLKKAGVPWRDLWETAIGNNEFIAAQPISSIAALDEPSAPVRALGADGARAFNERLSRLATLVRSYVITARPDLAVEPAATVMPRFAVMRTVVVAPGRGEEFEAMVKNQVVPAMTRAVAERSGVTGSLAASTVFGGPVNEYVFLTLQDNFASIARGSPIARVLGAAATDSLNHRMGPMLMSNRLDVLAYVPDASFQSTRPPAR